MVGARRFLGSRDVRGTGLSAREEGGFALIEVVIAFSVLLIALLGIGFEMGTQYASIGASHNEQTGDAVLNRLLDEARALPYTVVAKGLSNTDASVSSTSTYIRKTGTGTAIWVFEDSALGSGNGTGEVVNHYSPPTGLSPPPPFYPHKSCFSEKGASVTCTGGQYFTALTFPTKYGSKVTTGTTGKVLAATWLSKVIRVTVLVSWRAPGNGSPTAVAGQTLIFAKTVACTSLGLLSTPSAASCQPNFTATSRAGGGVVAVKPSTGAPAGEPIKGLTFSSFDLLLPGSTSSQTLTQTSSILGTSNASGGTIAPTSARDQESLVLTKATNDLATGTSDDQSLTLTQSASVLTTTSATSAFSVTATPSSTDTGSSTSTTSATSTHACASFTGTDLTTDLPCGAGRSTQGSSATLGATFGAAGAATLADVAGTAAHPDRVLTARYARGAVPTTCPTTARSGCIDAAAQGGLGTAELAGLPAAVTAPAGWSGYTVRLSGFRASATAWARSASHWLSGKMTTVAGTLSYYNGSGYTTLTLAVGSSAQAITIPAVKVTTGTITVDITPHLATGGAACNVTTTSSHPARVHLERCSVSPLFGTITYVVTDGATTLADFTMTVSLGTFSATASYQVAT